MLFDQSWFVIRKSLAFLVSNNGFCWSLLPRFFKSQLVSVYVCFLDVVTHFACSGREYTAFRVAYKFWSYRGRLTFSLLFRWMFVGTVLGQTLHVSQWLEIRLPRSKITPWSWMTPLQSGLVEKQGKIREGSCCQKVVTGLAVKLSRKPAYSAQAARLSCR